MENKLLSSTKRSISLLIDALIWKTVGALLLTIHGISSCRVRFVLRLLCKHKMGSGIGWLTHVPGMNYGIRNRLLYLFGSSWCPEILGIACDCSIPMIWDEHTLMNVNQEHIKKKQNDLSHANQPVDREVALFIGWERLFWFKCRFLLSDMSLKQAIHSSNWYTVQIEPSWCFQKSWAQFLVVLISTNQLLSDCHIERWPTATSYYLSCTKLAVGSSS